MRKFTLAIPAPTMGDIKDLNNKFRQSRLDRLTAKLANVDPGVSDDPDKFWDDIATMQQAPAPAF